MNYTDFLKNDRVCPFDLPDRQEILLENKTAYVTYALAPYHPDHLLVVPKRHAESIMDLTEEENRDIDRLAKTCLSIERDLGYQHASFLVREGKSSGKTVTHVHYHIIPETHIGDLDHLGQERVILSKNEIEALLKRLKPYFA